MMIKFVDLNPGHNKIKKSLNRNINNVIKKKKFILGSEAVKLENYLSKYVVS